MHMHLSNLAARPLVALLAFAAWAMALVFAIAVSRVGSVATGKVKANGFPSGVPHGHDAYWRLNRAHMNAVENLPIFAAIVLAGAALGVSSPRLALLSEVVVVARVSQSFFHLVSGKSWAVNLRFTSYAIQVGCWAAMIAETLRLATG